MTKILITGGNGFVGNNLFNYLKSKAFAGSYDVIKFASDLTVRADVLREVAEIKPNFIVHCGAIVSSVLCDIAKDYAIDVNIKGSYNIADAARINNSNFIYIGTTASYSNDDRIITENTQTRPHTLYGLTKLMGENISRFVLNENLLILRFCFAFGGIDDWHSGIQNIIRSFKEKRPCILQMSPEKMKDYMYIDDFCEAVRLSIDLNLKGIYNVSHQTPKKLKSIVELLKKYKVSPTIIYKPEDDYMGNHVVSSEKFRKATGWRPKYSLECGIKKCLKNTNLI